MIIPSESRLILGDCLRCMADIRDASVDMVLTDLPYGTTSNKWDLVIPIDQLWAEWKRICKPGAPIVLFTQQPFTTTVAASNLKQLKTEWIWEKPQGTGFLNANRYPLKSHENILVFCDRTPHIILKKIPATSHTQQDAVETPQITEYSTARLRRSIPTAHAIPRLCSGSIRRRDSTQLRNQSRYWNTS